MVETFAELTRKAHPTHRPDTNPDASRAAPTSRTRMPERT